MRVVQAHAQRVSVMSCRYSEPSLFMFTLLCCAYPQMQAHDARMFVQKKHPAASDKNKHKREKYRPGVC